MDSINSIASSLPLNAISTPSRRRNFRSGTRITASRSREADSAGRYYNGGKLVDESMIILRKRIHEMKMTETNFSPPADWMEWEKRYYATYDTHICEALGYLQSHLMNSRPSVALGMLALIAISVPTSCALLLFRFMEIAVAVLAGIRLG